MLANVVLYFFLKGGPVMSPILLCLIARRTVVMVERCFGGGSSRRDELRHLERVL